jgi:hypothetical protein
VRRKEGLTAVVTGRVEGSGAEEIALARHGVNVA